MPVIPPNNRASFLSAHTASASERIKLADANANGNLTRAEATALGDLKDTYDLYAEPGKTVKTDKVLEFYKSYTRVSVTSGELPRDLGDNYASWLDLRTRPPGGASTDTGRAIEAALADFSVPSLKVAVDAVELRGQEGLNNAVPFEAALRSALESFLKDGDDPESPLGLVSELNGGSRAENEAALRDLLNDPSTELSLMARTDSPEHGESVQDNWVFSLYIPGLSDHGHWAIVDRAGDQATYNYGFN